MTKRGKLNIQFVSFLVVHIDSLSKKKERFDKQELILNTCLP